MLSLLNITNHCRLPRSCQRLYLTGAIYKFQYEGLFWRRAVLGGGLLRKRLGLGVVWGAFSLYNLLHLQQFGDEVSPSNLSNQIPEFLVLFRVLGLPVEAIHPINVSQLSLQIF
jgi:hypothetical protein